MRQAGLLSRPTASNSCRKNIGLTKPSPGSTLYRNAENIDDKTRQPIIMVINKFFWIQNDFFTMHFITTSKENVSSSSSNK